MKNIKDEVIIASSYSLICFSFHIIHSQTTIKKNFC